MDFLNQFESYGDLMPIGIKMPEVKFHKEMSNKEFLTFLCEEGFDKFKIRNKDNFAEYEKRCRYELEVIDDLSFTDYILLVWDIINHCDENDIPRGAARGCLHPNTKIHTNKGFKRIEDVQIGDKVITHKGYWSNVTNKFKYDCDEDLLELDIFANDNEERGSFTSDHKVFCLKNPFPAAHPPKKGWSIEKYLDKFKLENCKWIPIGDVQEGDYVVRFPAQSENSSKGGVDESNEPLGENASLCIKQDGCFFLKVRGKNTVKNDFNYVCDIEVEGEHSYQTSNFVVHNSAAGSLVLYLIGVVQYIDPIEHNLLFERFISKSRSKKIEKDGVTYLDGGSIADVDLDICYYKRGEVTDYLNRKYAGSAAKITTINRLTSKLAIKEVAKAAGQYSEVEARVLADNIEKVFGRNDSLEKTLEESNYYKEWIKTPIEYGKKCSNREVFEIAAKLQDLPKNFGVHPAALAITDGAAVNTMPVVNREGDDVSGYDMYAVQDIAVKVDLLGLRTVSILDRVQQLTGVSLSDIDVNNEEIYLRLQDLKTPHGIFQIEADTQYQACRDIKPSNFAEVANIMAIARPGALAYIDEYVKRKNGLSEVKSMHPIWDRITKESYGFLLFQESQMALSHELFGFTLEEAGVLRKIIGKKQRDKIEEWEAKVYKKAEEKGLDKSLADAFYKSLKDSADYSFNKCMSPDTVVEKESGFSCMFDVRKGDKIKAYDSKLDKDHFVEVLNIYSNKVELYEVELENGLKVKASMDHKFMCEDKKMRPLREILLENHSIMCNTQITP